MKILLKINLQFLFLFLLISSGLNAQNTVCFTIEANPNSSDPVLGVFSKYINVHGCSIYAEANVADEKILHAAAIFAELIDNDEDGVPDDSALHTQLVNSEMLVPIFNFDGSPAMNNFFNNYEGDGACAVLWATEIDPSQPGHWGSDATVEEILHTINCVGHMNIYPSAFQVEVNSSLLTTAMDVARGGQFTSVPSSYPAAAWYQYDDTTCDYQCMAIEYLYWGIVTWMGILDDPSTCSGIANEWEPCSPTLFQNTDVLLHALLTDPQYKIPQLAPDGNYCPTTATDLLLNSSSISILPNPTETTFEIQGVLADYSIQILDVTGTVHQTLTASNNNLIIDITTLPVGLYFISVVNTNNSLVSIQKILKM